MQIIDVHKYNYYITLNYEIVLKEEYYIISNIRKRKIHFSLPAITGKSSEINFPFPYVIISTRQKIMSAEQMILFRNSKNITKENLIALGNEVFQPRFLKYKRLSYRVFEVLARFKLWHLHGRHIYHFSGSRISGLPGGSLLGCKNAKSGD